MNTNTKISNRSWVKHIDDERCDGNGIIITLASGWFFKDEKDCGVRGFDTIRDAEQGTRKDMVVFKD
jgi:hypothetical protein